MTDNNHYYELLNNHPHPEQRMPLISMLTDDTLVWLKREAGFPDDWCASQVSSWLGPTYDRILFRINQDRQYVNPVMYIETIYDNNVLDNDLHYYNVMIPISGFKLDYMSYMYNTMLHIDITSISEWGDYIHNGGRDRYMVRIRRYEPNLPFNVFSNYH